MQYSLDQVHGIIRTKLLPVGRVYTACFSLQVQLIFFFFFFSGGLPLPCLLACHIARWICCMMLSHAGFSRFSKKICWSRVGYDIRHNPALDIDMRLQALFADEARFYSSFRGAFGIRSHLLRRPVLRSCRVEFSL